ncbi:MAG: protein jag [Clostridiales bacterium]|jgi:spoIIIJ-associated protein|nr:protein jag [Clostridiales bacterium]
MEGMEFKAHKVEQAIELGLKELQLTAEEADVEVINHGGLFSKAIVKITPKIKPEQAAADFVNNLFAYMKFDANATLTKLESDNHIEIAGADSSLLIGYRGDILDSIQYLALIVANKGTKDFVRISVNAENYREKRKEILTRLAEKLAIKADRTGRKVELEPMNPYERRVMHAALQGSEIVTTESVGEEPNRYLVIIPKNPRPSGYMRDRRDGGQFNRGGGRGGYGGDRGYNGNGDRGYNGDRGIGTERRYDKDRDAGGARTYNNDRGYGGDRGGYNQNRGYGGERGGYSRGDKPYESRPRPSYSEERNATREQPNNNEEKERDYSDVNSSFSDNFKKNGTTKLKSFGYKKR